MNNKNNSYSAESIQVLEFPEAVRKRPGMWLGGQGEEALIQAWEEAIANAADENQAGYCSEAITIIHEDNAISVIDNGRGIPVGIHPVEKKSTLEVVMTTLHAGGKFDKSSYKISGGLHGVGISCVNALSSYFKATVCRDGEIHEQEYKKGIALGEARKIGTTRKRGTTVYFKPDASIFTTTIFDRKILAKRLQELAFLNPGFKLKLKDLRVEAEEDPYSETFHYQGGLVEFVKHINKGKEEIISQPIHIKGSHELTKIEIALTYTSLSTEKIFSYVNNIFTKEGGTHVSGFKMALNRVFKEYIEKAIGKEKSKVPIIGDDFREGLTAVIAVKVAEPQFKGQTKTKLGNSEVQTAVRRISKEALETYVEENPSNFKILLNKFVIAAKARKAAQDAREMVQRKNSLLSTTLPGKLADCSEKDPAKSEIFFVEGESAAGTAKMARERKTQAILSLRGKILNIQKAQEHRIYENEQIKNIITALGIVVKPSEDGSNFFSIEKLRYHKIIIMTDADVDGSHILTLLLTFFFKYTPELIERGHIFIAQPPLFLVKNGKNKLYCWDEETRDKTIAVWRSKYPKSTSTTIRYKGLGEMNPDQLWDTTIDPIRRKLKKISIESMEEANNCFEVLMGHEVSPRKKFIDKYALTAKLDI